MTFGEPLLRYQTVGSTQDVARERVRAGASAGTVIAADAMTAGRGRRGRSWWLPPGANVSLTAIGAATPAERLWQLAPLAGLAVQAAVREVAPAAEVWLRFPNDLALCGKKLAGVLIETLAVGEAHIPLVGIGVNVLPRVWPEELESSAIALGEVAPTSVREVEAAVLRHLTRWWERWARDGFAAVAAAWNEGREPEAWRTFILDGRPTRCQVRELTAEGLVHLQDGESARTLPAARVVLGES